MRVSGSYDIINTMVNFNATNFDTGSPQIDNLFKGAVAARYTNSINNLLSNEINQFMDSLNTEIKDMSSTLDSLFDEGSQQFSAAPEIETPNTITISETTEAESFELQVDQLAEGQENTSDSVDADDTNTLNEGENTFSITQGEDTFEFRVDVKSYDTNRTVLSDIAGVINDAQIGITAQLQEQDNGEIALQVRSNETGESNAFDISGELSDAFNLNQTTQVAQNALFTLNGEAFESESNTIKLQEENITIELTETTEEPITFNVEENNEGIIAEVERFESQFNELKSFLNESSDNKQVDLINKQVDQLVQRFETDLNEIGIEVNQNGTLEIDDERLQAAVEENPDKVREVFTESASFGDRLEGRVESIDKLPDATFIENQISSQSPSGFSNPSSYLSNAQSVDLAAIQSQGNLIDILF